MANTLTEALEELFSTITGHKDNVYRAIKKYISVPSGDDKLSRASYYIGKMNEQIESGSSSVSELQAELERVKGERDSLKTQLAQEKRKTSSLESQLEGKISEVRGFESVSEELRSKFETTIRPVAYSSDSYTYLTQLSEFMNNPDQGLKNWLYGDLKANWTSVLRPIFRSSSGDFDRDWGDGGVMLYNPQYSRYEGGVFYLCQKKLYVYSPVNEASNPSFGPQTDYIAYDRY